MPRRYRTTRKCDKPLLESAPPIRRAARAFSLIEGLMASVVLSFSVIAISAALTLGQQHALEAANMRYADDLAGSLMEEALCLPYDDPNGPTLPGPESGERNRRQFDNLDDFHGWLERAGTLTDATRTALPAEYQAFERSVTVAAAQVQPAGFPVAVPGQTVTVTVKLSGRPMVVLTRFVAQPPT